MSDNISSTPVDAQENSSGHEHHHRHHRHPPNHGFVDMAEANRQHYDEHANDFDNYPHVKERAKRTALAIREAVPLDKDFSDVLEFACGTGLVCKEMLPYVREIVGIDISPAIVERCNMRFKEEGANEGCYAFAANIVTDEGVLRGRTFDLVYCASAYHHFEFPEEITRLLGEYVKPGGSFIIIDHVQIEGKTVSEERRNHVTRYGFTEDDIKQLFAGVGLEFVSYTQVPPDEGDNDIFIAKGVKAT